MKSYERQREIMVSKVEEGLPLIAGVTAGPKSETNEREPAVALRIEVPMYLDGQISFAAVDNRCTKQHLVMKALAIAGYQVREEDLVTDGRKVRR